MKKMIMMQDSDDDDNATAQLHMLNWSIGQISHKADECALCKQISHLYEISQLMAQFHFQGWSL